MTWQPIETAPNDGRVLIAYSERSGIEFLRFSYIETGSDSYGPGWLTDNEDWREPTHWMPLPEPPETPDAA